MIILIRQKPESSKDKFEKTALRITGVGFYVLVATLTSTNIYNIWTDHKPETTFWGVIISILSTMIMWTLVLGKRKVGKQLDSRPIIADAQCTMVCVYMSVILLISIGLYELFHISYIDSIGTLGLAYFAFKEGKECFENAKSDQYCYGD